MAERRKIQKTALLSGRRSSDFPGEQNYSKRELDTHFQTITDQLTELNRVNNEGMADIRRESKEATDRIEKKVDYTNGTVRWHTKMIYLVSGAVAVLGWLYANGVIHIFN